MKGHWGHLLEDDDDGGDPLLADLLQPEDGLRLLDEDLEAVKSILGYCALGLSSVDCTYIHGNLPNEKVTSCVTAGLFIALEKRALLSNGTQTPFQMQVLLSLLCTGCRMMNEEECTYYRVVYNYAMVSDGHLEAEF